MKSSRLWRTATRIGVDNDKSDFKGEMEDISDEIGKQREALRKAERAAQAVIDRAS